MLLDIVNVNFAISICDGKQVFVKVPPFVVFILDLFDTMDVIIFALTFIHDVPSDVKLTDSDYAFV